MKKIISFALMLCLVMGFCVVPVFADGALPNATTKEISVDSLSFAMSFASNDSTDENVATAFDDWLVDFYLSVDGMTSDKVVFDADGNGDGWLSGQYDYNSNAWVNVPFGGKTVELVNGQQVPVMTKAFELYPELKNAFNIDYINYKIVRCAVQTFNCGIFLDPEFIANNPNVKFTLSLVMTDRAKNEVHTIGNPIVYQPGGAASNNPNSGTTAPEAPAVENIYYIPATDDNSNMALWSILALALLTTAFVTRRKKTEN